MKVYQTCDEMKIKTQLRRLQLKGKNEFSLCNSPLLNHSLELYDWSSWITINTSSIYIKFKYLPISEQTFSFFKPLRRLPASISGKTWGCTLLPQDSDLEWSWKLHQCRWCNFLVKMRNNVTIQLPLPKGLVGKSFVDYGQFQP